MTYRVRHYLRWSLYWVLLSLSACSEAAKLQNPNRESQTMTVAIEIHWMIPEFQVGGIMPAMITVRNHSQQTIQVPPSVGASPFSWHFAKVGSNQQYDFSEADRAAMLAGGARPLNSARVDVPPDSALSYRVDLADALLGPIATGNYQVTATMATTAGVFSSPATPVQINSPLFRSISQRVVPGTQRLFTVAVTEQGDPVVGISPRQHANLSVLRQLERDPLVAQPFLAYLSSGDAPGFWGVWLADSTLRGAFFEPNLIADHFNAGDLGFTAEEILGAFQYADGLASFVVSGQSSRGRQVKLVHLRSLNKFDIETLVAEPPAKAEIAVSLDEQHQQVWLHWQEGEGAHAKIVSVNGSSGQQLQWQADGGQSLLSWSVPSSWQSLSAFLIVEQSSAPNTVKRVAQQFNLSNKSVLAERVLPELNVTVKEWVLPSSSGSGLLLAARAENQLYWPDISGSQWISESTTASHVAIHSFNSQYAWLTWYAPNQGIEFANLFWPTENAPQAAAVP